MLFYDPVPEVTHDPLYHILLVKEATGLSYAKGGTEVPLLGGRNCKEFVAIV